MAEASGDLKAAKEFVAEMRADPQDLSRIERLIYGEEKIIGWIFITTGIAVFIQGLRVYQRMRQTIQRLHGAIRIGRQIVRHLNWRKADSRPLLAADEPALDPEELLGLVSRDLRQPLDVREVLEITRLDQLFEIHEIEL